MDRVSAEVIRQILSGGAAKVKEAKCALVGGHTIQNPEPVYGLSVTGVVHPRRILTNAAAKPGDLLVLTKPLGTGIATTGIKRGLTSPKLARRAIAAMRRLNDVGPELAERGLIKAATDITGFGLIGHLANICRASGVGAEIDAGKVPALSNEIFDLISKDCIPGGSRANLEAAESIARWNGTPERLKVLLTDAQTSGGLLLCVTPKHFEQVSALLRKHRTPCAEVIGAVRRAKTARVDVR
jgi:selenide,water dikinase